MVAAPKVALVEQGLMKYADDGRALMVTRTPGLANSFERAAASGCARMSDTLRRRLNVYTLNADADSL